MNKLFYYWVLSFAICISTAALLFLTVQEYRHKKEFNFYSITPIQEIFSTQGGMSATDVDLSKSPVSFTSFSRELEIDIPAMQTLSLIANCNDGTLHRVYVRDPIKIILNRGYADINIAYNVYDFGLQEFIDSGKDISMCKFFWNKDWDMMFPFGIHRRFELKSNLFCIVDKKE